MATALDGLRVVDLSSGPSGAIASMFLADNGARVVRVADPASPAWREGGFIVWDRGKEAVTLDLDAATRGEGAVRRDLDILIAGADVLLEDFAPSSPRQALVAHDRLRKINPRLVACSITAYGKRGPLRDDPPIDDLVLARMGILSGMPGFRPAPVHVVHPLPTVAAALFGAIGIAAALLAREKTGRGRFVETSLMAGALLYHSKLTGSKLARHVFQTHPSGSAPFYSVYRCRDGSYVQLGCVHVAFIAIAAKLMGLAELIAEPRFDQGRAPKTPADDKELRGRVAEVIATRPYADWARDFEQADVPFAEARLSEEGLSDPQVIHNAMVATLDDPAIGKVTQMGVPIQLSVTPGRVGGPRRAPSTALPADWPAIATSSGDGTAATVEAPPLEGVRILEITNLIAGPTAGRLLADLGADVIKLEPPGGDMSRPIGRTYFYSVNFNKRSLCIDTGTDAGRRIVQAIAASADALLANLRPHATERMGIGAKFTPRLIETHLTGYGWTGPYSKRPGIDPLAQALMGLQRAQGGPDNPPVFPAQLAPTDYTTGAMGTLGTILALFARARTGVAQRVDANLLSGGVILSSPWFTRYAGKPERPLADKDQYGLTPFHRLFKLADGWIYVTARDGREEQAVARLAGIAADKVAAFEQDRVAMHPNATPLARALGDAFATRKVAPTLAALSEVGVAATECVAGDSEVFLADPHAAANDMVAVRAHPKAGELQVAWQFIQFAGTRPSAGRPTPLLGEHTDEVMGDAGFSADEIAAFHRDGTVRKETA